MTTTTPQSARRRNLLVGAAVVVVLLALLAVGISASGGSDEERSTSADGPVAEVGTPTVRGEALPELEDPTDDPAVGEQAPLAAGSDFGGAAVEVGDGQPQLIAFVAHWCPHCQAEVPRMVQWLADGDLPTDTPIRMVVTATDERQPNYPPSEWLAEERWEGPVLVDSADVDVARAYGVSGFPFFVAVDGDGKVVARTSGELTLAQMKSLLATIR